MSQIRSTEVLERVEQSLNGNKVIVVEDGFYNQSLPTTVIGNATTEILEPCGDGMCRVVKAITITGDGNTGTAKVKVGNTVVLPLYFTVQNKVMTSAGLRLKVEAGEAITVTTESRGETNETFVGITYYNTDA